MADAMSESEVVSCLRRGPRTMRDIEAHIRDTIDGGACRTRSAVSRLITRGIVSVEEACGCLSSSSSDARLAPPRPATKARR